MEDAIRAFLAETGQRQPADRGTTLRIVYESLALKYRLVNDQICAICGTPTQAVHIVGGGSGNALLNQFTADAIGVPVHAGPQEGTAVGNLMVQAMALGVIRSMAEAQPLIRAAFPIKTFQPGDTVAWNAASARFLALNARAQGGTEA
jgi:rhamnulokinase